MDVRHFIGCATATSSAFIVDWFVSRCIPTLKLTGDVAPEQAL